MDQPSSSRPGAQPVPERPAPSRASAFRASERRRSSVPSDEAARREEDERTLIELRRKVQAGDLLSASTERLLWKMRFNGHLTLVIQNGRIFKSGYEEGYFRRRQDLGGFLLDL